MSVLVQASTVGGSLFADQGSLTAGCSSAAGSSSGRTCSVSTRGASWRTEVREHRLLCVSQARRTWQVCAKPKRQKEDEDEDMFFPEAEEIDREALQAFLDLELQTNYDLDDARHYEIMFLVPEDQVEKVPDVIKKVEAFVEEQKGKVWRVNDWGLRRLAYKIKKNEKANYVLMNIEMNPAAINQLNTMFEKDERVIRHMCMSQKEAYTEESVPPPNYYNDSADGTEAQDEDDSDDDEEDDEEEEDEEDDGASSSQENRGWDQIVQGQESSVAL
ncbi:hypothetical protein KC19_2G103300 [Ceratodon purpureus]|uniref:30S ribosomal protein S6 n=1 Tax=Ceratodon purpureus TaxID=3225 RepID=A0A8T0IV96_CERPU|nr:hypothetical protein KC19_2G103300 [Ceratodon purpureus]